MVDAETRRLVRQRAENRCEYCHLPEVLGDVTFHVEHVVARQHQWNDHFAFSGPEIVGLTPIGRATVQLLKMNAPRRVAIRRRMMARGETP